jgi:hypothetical protein
MGKLNLRSIIKEELAKALNEIAAKFQEGDTFIYMGQKHIVVSDNGYTIEAKLPNGKIKKYNYNQIKDKLAENVVLAKTDQGGRSAMRGIESLIKQYPNLPLQDLVDSALTDNNINSIGDLSVEDVYKLNTKIRSSITSSNPKPTSPQDKTNPYDSPGGRPSKGYMGAKYTGD